MDKGRSYLYPSPRTGQGWVIGGQEGRPGVCTVFTPCERAWPIGRWGNYQLDAPHPLIGGEGGDTVSGLCIKCVWWVIGGQEERGAQCSLLCLLKSHSNYVTWCIRIRLIGLIVHWLIYVALILKHLACEREKWLHMYNLAGWNLVTLFL